MFWQRAERMNRANACALNCGVDAPQKEDSFLLYSSMHAVKRGHDWLGQTLNAFLGFICSQRCALKVIEPLSRFQRKVQLSATCRAAGAANAGIVKTPALFLARD